MGAKMTPTHLSRMVTAEEEMGPLSKLCCCSLQALFFIQQKVPCISKPRKKGAKCRKSTCKTSYFYSVDRKV